MFGKNCHKILKEEKVQFRNVSKQQKHLDLVNFCHVSVRFNFSPI